MPRLTYTDLRVLEAIDLATRAEGKSVTSRSLYDYFRLLGTTQAVQNLGLSITKLVHTGMVSKGEKGSLSPTQKGIEYLDTLYSTEYTSPTTFYPDSQHSVSSEEGKTPYFQIRRAWEVSKPDISSAGELYPGVPSSN